MASEGSGNGGKIAKVVVGFLAIVGALHTLTQIPEVIQKSKGVLNAAWMVFLFLFGQICIIASCAGAVVLIYFGGFLIISMLCDWWGMRKLRREHPDFEENPQDVIHFGPEPFEVNQVFYVGIAIGIVVDAIVLRQAWQAIQSDPYNTGR